MQEPQRKLSPPGFSFLHLNIFDINGSSEIGGNGVKRIKTCASSGHQRKMSDRRKDDLKMIILLFDVASFVKRKADYYFYFQKKLLERSDARGSVASSEQSWFPS
jgi:hypothetical protein